jgi:hypothetical protein
MRAAVGVVGLSVVGFVWAWGMPAQHPNNVAAAVVSTYKEEAIIASSALTAVLLASMGETNRNFPQHDRRQRRGVVVQAYRSLAPDHPALRYSVLSGMPGTAWNVLQPMGRNRDIVKSKSGR